MKHEWEHVRATMATFLQPQKRRCKNCGKVQELHIEQAWMRIVGRRWLPLIGRCKGPKIDQLHSAKETVEDFKKMPQRERVKMLKKAGLWNVLPTPKKKRDKR